MKKGRQKEGEERKEREIGWRKGVKVIQIGDKEVVISRWNNSFCRTAKNQQITKTNKQV